jgi:hypothetical protein
MMSDLEQVITATKEALGSDVSVAHIDEALLREYEVALQEETAKEVEAPDEADASPEARTKVLFGNHPVRRGDDFMFKSNGAGQPCGTGFVLHVKGWQSIAQTQVEMCPGHFPGYKFTFSYRS